MPKTFISLNYTATEHTHTYIHVCMHGLLSSLFFYCNASTSNNSGIFLISVFACESISHSTEKVKWWAISCCVVSFRFVMVFFFFLALVRFFLFTSAGKVLALFSGLFVNTFAAAAAVVVVVILCSSDRAFIARFSY